MIIQMMGRFYGSPHTAFHEVMHLFGLKDWYKTATDQTAVTYSDIMNHSKPPVRLFTRYIGTTGSGALGINRPQKEIILSITFGLNNNIYIMKSFLAILFFMFFLSCNRALLVSKGNVIHNQQGYLFFYYSTNEALFFPSNDTVNFKFLAHDHFNGYKVGNGEKGLDYLMSIADSAIVFQNVKRDNESLTVENVVRLIPVNIKYYWGDNYKSKKPTSKDERIAIRYFLNDDNLKMVYRLYDSRIIMSISPTRYMDKGRLTKTD